VRVLVCSLYINRAADFKAVLNCIISRKQKACSCAASTTGAAHAASGMWRAQGRASHALCLEGSPMGGPSYV